MIRDGVDHRAIEAMLKPLFDEVAVTAYWSAHAAVWQAFGQRLGWKNTFAAVARGYNPPS